VKRTLTSGDWPLEQTRWTKFHLDAGAKTLALAPPAKGAEASYRALSPGVTFSTAPFEKETQFAGPVKAKLFISSTTPDTDLFATVCAFGADGKEMTFLAAPEPKAPATQGWLRLSQRRTDPKRSTEYLPYYPHDERHDLAPGEVYEVDLEIWPISIAMPAGSRLTLTLQGKDFERPGETGPMRGVAWFTHEDPTDRPAERFDGTNVLHTGGARESYLLMPIVS